MNQPQVEVVTAASATVAHRGVRGLILLIGMLTQLPASHAADPATPAVSPPRATGELISLFNGRDLIGWQTEGTPESPLWGVRDGLLTSLADPATSKQPVRLSTTRLDWRYLHLQFEYRLSKGGDARLSPRGEAVGKTPFQIVLRDEAGGELRGPAPQDNVIFGPDDHTRKQAHRPGEWNRCELLIDQQDQLSVSINGVTTVSKLARPWRNARGPLVLEDREGELQLRQIVLRELPEWTPAVKDERGILTHEVRSPLQDATTLVRVLLPQKLEPGRRYPVVYVLPVEAGLGQQYGDGLREVWQHDLQNKHQAVFVSPTFAKLPWYADHPTDLGLRQESHLLQIVLPCVEKHYPVRTERAGRLLLGFSKSGFGAFTLLLRTPQMFDKAAIWDAPLMMAQPNKYGMEPIYGTQANFEQYHIPRLLEQRAKELKQEGRPRLIIVGYGNFRDHHEQAHTLLQKLDIPHLYPAAQPLKHTWHTGWVADATRLLFRPE